MCKVDRVFDETVELKGNAMLRHRVELFHEWDFEKNDELKMDVYGVTKGSDKIAWWTCPKCESSYDIKIGMRASNNTNCPYCSGNRVNYTNSLASLRPDLASEWHSTLNGKWSPHNVTLSKNLKVWWLGAECGHPWDAFICDRTKENGTGCPYCSSNPKILKGFNDMWTTAPELASMLANPEDGFRYTQSSGIKVDWKCLECDSTLKRRTVKNVNKQGLFCASCSDGLSFGEKFMHNLLKEKGINFEFDTTQSWSEKLRYDFYLPDYNWIIEVHGIQHYAKSFERMGKGARTVQEEQENDKLKEELAKNNGIVNYIVIDARESTVERMKNSIENSDIMKISDEIDFVRIGQLASNSFIEIACDLWNSGLHSTKEISAILKVHQTTVRKYLKRGAEIGWCDYSVEKARKERKSTLKRPIVQISPEGNSTTSWDSIVDASNATKTYASGISRACCNTIKTAGGFKWMYKEDYNKLIASQSNTQEEIINKVV